MSNKRKAELPPAAKQRQTDAHSTATIQHTAPVSAAHCSRLPHSLLCSTLSAVVKDNQPKSDPSLTNQPTGAVVFPGDVLQLRGTVVRLGAGLLASEGHKVVASRAGRVKQGANSKLSIDNSQKRVSTAAAILTRAPLAGWLFTQMHGMCASLTVHSCSRGSRHRHSG